MGAPKGNKNALGNDGGRETLYESEYAEQAGKLCELGATDEEIADFFSVSVRTIYRWKLNHVEFCQALKAGKELADERVERAFYQQATGYYFTEQQAHKLKTDQYKEMVEIVDVERYQPPNPTAAFNWLRNRRPESWREKSETEHKLPQLDDLMKELSSLTSLVPGKDDKTS